jgi:hypothetical protein
MSLLVLAMLARAAAVPPPPPAPPPPPKVTPVPAPDRPLGPDVGVGTDELSEEIVIIARKLRMVHVRNTLMGPKGPVICTVLRSSGDAEVDMLTCEAAKTCRLKFSERVPPGDLMQQCTKDEQARLVEELAEKRIEEEYSK